MIRRKRRERERRVFEEVWAQGYQAGYTAALSDVKHGTMPQEPPNPWRSA